MRTSLSIVAIALGASSSVAAAPETPVSVQCDQIAPHLVGGPDGETGRPHALDREPDAKAYLALARMVDGCLKPLRVRSNLGAAAVGDGTTPELHPR